jgi:hypothetical protein
LSFLSPNDGMNIVIDVIGWEIIESITWVSKEYKGNSAEISEYIYIYIYIYIYNLVTTNIYHIFWVYNMRLLQLLFSLKMILIF